MTPSTGSEKHESNPLSPTGELSVWTAVGEQERVGVSRTASEGFSDSRLEDNKPAPPS